MSAAFKNSHLFLLIFISREVLKSIILFNNQEFFSHFPTCERIHVLLLFYVLITK